MSFSALFVGRGRAVICSDSRRIDGFGNALDDQRKLFQAGRLTSLSIAGLCDFGEQNGPRVHIPDRIEKLLSDASLLDRPQNLLSAIGDDLYEPIARLFEWESERFEFINYREVEGLFMALVLRRSCGGQIDLLSLKFPVDWAGQRPTLTKPLIETMAESFFPMSPGGILFGGQTQAENAVLEKASTKFDASLPDEGILKCADDLFGEAARAIPSIGGPTDVATLEPGGFRWLRKKPRCQLK